MNSNYKQNKSYGYELSDKKKMSARERNVRDRLSLLKKSGIFPPAEILEVGSHEGLFLKMAKENGYGVLGIEPNEHAAKHALANGIETIEGYFEESFDKVKDKKFDVVALFHTLEHMPDYLGNLEKIKMLMKPGGYLIIEVPNSESYRSKKYGDDWVYVYEEHLHYFSPSGIKEILSSIGFTIKKRYFRDFDEMRMSIKWSLDRLLPIKFKNANVKNKSNGQEKVAAKGKIYRGIKIMDVFLTPARFFLALLVKILKRGDFVFIVAKIK